MRARIFRTLLILNLIVFQGASAAFGADSEIEQLKKELNEHLHTHAFSKCRSMGQVVKRHLKQTLQKNLMLVQKNLGKASD